MRIEPGQVAAITGGGSGIGRELAFACAARGMAVAIGDIEPDAGEQTVALLAERGATAFAQQLDVTRPEQMEAFAARTFEELGGCNLLCNNAGVLLLGTVLEATRADWDWVLGVNLFGIINGIASFVPRMIASTAPAHILNTISLRGMATTQTCGVYAASKFGALGLTETLHAELADSGVGVTALCPWSVNTAIVASERNRPVAGAAMPADDLQALIDAAPSTDITIEPHQVATVAIEAVERDELYAITHPCARDLLLQRSDAILSSLERLRQRHPELP